MTFLEYERIFKKTAIYPDAGNNIYYPTLGLAGESGEVAEKVKKVMRDDGGSIRPEVREELKKELGDVLWYLNALCLELGTTLEIVSRMNTEKLLSRLERNKLRGSGDNR
jgi:NTP pyrophosphatase (non-canonical NTP hydrolase)